MSSELKEGARMPYNKRMQSDQNARYAFILTADAKRYVAKTKRIKATCILTTSIYGFS